MVDFCKGGNKPPIFIKLGNFRYLKKYISYVASLKDSTEACLKISFFWNVTLRNWVTLFQRFEGLSRFQLGVSEAVFMRLHSARNLGINT